MSDMELLVNSRHAKESGLHPKAVHRQVFYVQLSARRPHTNTEACRLHQSLGWPSYVQDLVQRCALSYGPSS